MKKIVKIFMTVAAGMMAFSCATDTTDDLGVNLGKGQKTVISASLEESRTQLGGYDEVNEKYPMYWSEGDKISVNGVESESAVISEANGAVASFTVSGVEKPFCIAYPAAPEGQVLFAENQTHTAGTFGDGVSTMYGYGEEGANVTLNHLTGILKIGITGSATLKSAQISTVDRTPIAGAFNLDFAKGVVTPTADAKSVINYSFGDGVALKGDATYIHVAVPAGIYDELYVTLYDDNKGVMYATVKAGDTKPLKAGQVREFKKDEVEQLIAYAPNTDVYIVKDAGTLAGVKSNLTKKVVMVADVDMSGVTDWESIENFTGEFNGNGYAIKGLKAPLFGTTSAVIKGVHLEDVTISAASTTIGALVSTYTGASLSHCSVSGSITVAGGATATVVGGLVGVASNSTAQFSDLVNRASIEITGSSTTATLHVGGCFGKWYSDGATAYQTTLNNVDNYGGIKLNCTSQTKASYVGGIMGGVTEGCESTATTDYLKFTNCDNVADAEDKNKIYLTNGDYGTLQIGGIVGQCISKLEVSNSSNSMDMSFDANTGGSGANMWGGVVGWPRNNLSVDTFTNSGDITVQPKTSVAGFACFGGVMGYMADKTLVSFTINNAHNSGDIYVEKVSGSMRVVGGLLGIIRYGHTVTVSNSSNSGSLCGSGDSVKDSFVGGLMGATWENTIASFTNCHNTAEASVTGNNGYNIYVGGFIGFSRGDTTFNSCTNSAKVLISGTCAIPRIGGLIGGQNDKGGLTLDNVSNSGTVKVGDEGKPFSTSNSTGDLRVGGIIGQLASPTSLALTAPIVNKGDVVVVNATVTKPTAGPYIGGLAGYTDKPISNMKVFNTVKVYSYTGDLYDANIEQSTFTNVGMVTGTPYSDTIKATDCYVGGWLCKGLKYSEDDDRQIEVLTEIESGKLFQYIYGGNNNTADTASGCTYWDGK